MVYLKDSLAPWRAEHPALLPKAECAHETLSSFIFKSISWLKWQVKRRHFWKVSGPE